MDIRMSDQKCRPGDVLLVQGSAPQSKALAVIQKALYPKATSSHVEFNLADGIFVHAMKNQGVVLTCLLDELKTIESNWRVIRLKGLSEEQYQELSSAGYFYMKQDYNKAFLGSGSETSSFCSELIAKIYQKADISILDDKLPSKVTPSDFDREADEQDTWEDVTEDYKEFLNTIHEHSDYYKFMVDTHKKGLYRRLNHNDHRSLLLDITQKINLADGNLEAFQRIEEAKKAAKDGRSLNFWNQKDMEPYESKKK